jgi:hypothetical protein
LVVVVHATVALVTLKLHVATLSPTTPHNSENNSDIHVLKKIRSAKVTI